MVCARPATGQLVAGRLSLWPSLSMWDANDGVPVVEHLAPCRLFAGEGQPVDLRVGVVDRHPPVHREGQAQHVREDEQVAPAQAAPWPLSDPVLQQAPAERLKTVLRERTVVVLAAAQ